MREASMKRLREQTDSIHLIIPSVRRLTRPWLILELCRGVGGDIKSQMNGFSHDRRLLSDLAKDQNSKDVQVNRDSSFCFTAPAILGSVLSCTYIPEALRVCRVVTEIVSRGKVCTRGARALTLCERSARLCSSSQTMFWFTDYALLTRSKKFAERR